MAAVTAQCVDLVEADDFNVTQFSGLIVFHRDLRDIEILWESPRIPPATRSNRDADLERFGYRPFLTVDEAESRAWGALITSEDVVRLRGYSAIGRLGGTP